MLPTYHHQLIQRFVETLVLPALLRALSSTRDTETEQRRANVRLCRFAWCAAGDRLLANSSRRAREFALGSHSNGFFSQQKRLDACFRAKTRTRFSPDSSTAKCRQSWPDWRRPTVRPWAAPHRLGWHRHEQFPTLAILLAFFLVAAGPTVKKLV